MPSADQQPVHILAISPYEALTTSLTRAAEDFPRIRLEAHTGDLQEGVEIMRRLGTERFDAVLSRGGTAELIRTQTDLPVIEIPVSIYDILRTIKLSENYTDRCAIAGFSAVAENAYTLCNLLRLKIPIETVRDSGDVVPILDKFQAQDIHTVICDMVTYRSARSRGFNALLINSGENSLCQALAEAEAQGGCFRRLRRENQLLRSMLSMDSQQWLVLDEDWQPALTFDRGMQEDLIRELRRQIPSVPETGSTLFYHHIGDNLHIVTASKLDVQGQPYYYFRDQPRQIPLRSVRPGIRAYDRVECEHLLKDSFFSVSGSMGELESRLTPIAAAESAIMIVGEEGTGKEQIARSLYLRSRYKNRPLVAVDGARMNERGWDYLLRHEASPLSGMGSTVFFKHVEDIPPERQRDLISLIEETAMDRRLWMIFSCSEREDQPVTDFSRALSATLAPLTVHLPTLRSRRDEIPALSSVYLSNLNMELGKQLAGFEPGALEMLLRYEWPGNYTQFKSVLKELAVITSGPYISASDVADVMAKEHRMHRQAVPVPAEEVYSGQSLDDIAVRVVHRVLNANGGNQSLTARQLGISRTTLWRMLSRSER